MPTASEQGAAIFRQPGVIVAIPNNTPEGREASRAFFGGFFAGMSKEAERVRWAEEGVRHALRVYRKAQYTTRMGWNMERPASWRRIVREEIAKVRKARAVLVARYGNPAERSAVKARLDAEMGVVS